MISLSTDNRMLGYELLDAFPNISHFVTTRFGGYGKGNYASFNCTSYTGDDAETVRRNRELLVGSLSVSPVRLIIPRQVHGTEIRIIDSPESFSSDMLEGVDALITSCPGYCLCISTADCVPLLLYDKRQHVVAAIHAGWRGTVEKIVNKTLQLMKSSFQTHPIDIIACIGPSISIESFEVGNEVYDTFRDKGFNMDTISRRNEETQKYHINLWEANKTQLTDFGVPESQIECAGICTYINHETFFSARRLGIHSGRTLSGIMLNPQS